MSFWKYIRAFLIFDWLFGDSDNSNYSHDISSNYNNSKSGSYYDDLDLMDSDFNNNLYHDDSNYYSHYDDFHDECDDYDMMDDF